MEIIDFDNSFVDFIGSNSWRTNVKSVLECKSSKLKHAIKLTILSKMSSIQANILMINWKIDFS